MCLSYTVHILYTLLYLYNFYMPLSDFRNFLINTQISILGHLIPLVAINISDYLTLYLSYVSTFDNIFKLWFI